LFTGLLRRVLLGNWASGIVYSRKFSSYKEGPRSNSLSPRLELFYVALLLGFTHRHHRRHHRRRRHHHRRRRRHRRLLRLLLLRRLLLRRLLLRLLRP
jgi:hypothetical protein